VPQVWEQEGFGCTRPRLRGDYEEKLTTGNIMKGPLSRYALPNTGALRPHMVKSDIVGFTEATEVGVKQRTVAARIAPRSMAPKVNPPLTGIGHTKSR
jgi:hypothetical protein